MSTGDSTFRTIALIILAAVLLISWSALSSTRSLQQQVQALQEELHGLRSQITHDVGSIQGTVQSIRDDARWYTTPRYEVMDVEEEGAVTVKLSWILQEYTEGSAVTLNYRYGEQASFQEIEAVEESSGFFAAVFPLQIVMEPAWHFSVSSVYSDSNTKTSHSRAAVSNVEEKWDSGTTSHMLLEYYITLQAGKTMRTSEQHTMELASLSYIFFNPLDLHIQWENEEKLNVRLKEILAEESLYKIQTAYLESRTTNGETIERWPLKRIDMQQPAGAPQPAPWAVAAPFEVTAIPEQEYASLFVLVEYTDDITVEKEIATAAR